MTHRLRKKAPSYFLPPSNSILLQSLGRRRSWNLLRISLRGKSTTKMPKIVNRNAASKARLSPYPLSSDYPPESEWRTDASLARWAKDVFEKNLSDHDIAQITEHFRHASIGSLYAPPHLPPCSGIITCGQP